jgi:hypothetical protein
MLTAACMSAAAARGAYASTFLELSLLPLDSSTTILRANILPDETMIVDVPLSTNGATCLVPFANLTPNPAVGFTASGGNASQGPEAFDDSNLLFTPQLDQEIFGVVSVTFLAEAPHSGILSAGLDADEEAGNFAIAADAPDTPDAKTWDSTTLALTCLGFALAGAVGRSYKVLARLRVGKNRHARLGPAPGIAF